MVRSLLRLAFTIFVLSVSLGCSANPLQPSTARSFTGTWRGHFQLTTCDTDYPDIRGCSVRRWLGFDEYVTFIHDGTGVTGTFGGGPYFAGVVLRGTAQGSRVVLSGLHVTPDLTDNIAMTADLLNDGGMTVRAEQTVVSFSTFFQKWFTTHRVAVGESLRPDP